MRIDTHQHFWRYNRDEYGWIDDSMAALRRDFLPADVKPEMDRVGFDVAIAVQARQTVEETRWLLALADAHPHIGGVIGWVDLQADDVRDQLTRLAAHPKLVGIRHIVQAEPDDRFLLRPAFCRGISVLEELRLVYDILIFGRHLPIAAEFVARFPEQRFVLDHVAKPDIRGREIRDWERNLRRLAAFPHVYCKLSGLVTEADWRRWSADEIHPYLDVAFDCFGPDRLMIGSDWPVCTVAADYGRTMAVVIEYVNDRPVAEREAVLGGNAQRFYEIRKKGSDPFSEGLGMTSYPFSEEVV